MAEVICVVPVAPIRSEGSHRAEMVSQILFGETATIIGETKDFYQIQMHQDDMKVGARNCNYKYYQKAQV
jgi:hypothetical protein